MVKMMVAMVVRMMVLMVVRMIIFDGGQGDGNDDGTIGTVNL